ncbi:MAG: hypothetical protein CMN05_04455 [Roseibacillus sp.]|nr:hypothetical protein [Roseibacillus sp.]MBP36435.1 hypothetical protein [Roseibacillus sp.]
MTDEEPLTTNPVVSNPDAYWCYRCKAHNPFDHLTWRTYRANSDDTYEKMSCVRCQSSMFNPARTKPVMVGLLGFTLVALIVGLVLGGDFLAPSLLFAAFSGLIGFMMLYYMNLWWSWSRLQGGKSTEQLEKEGGEHIALIEKGRK